MTTLHKNSTKPTPPRANPGVRRSSPFRLPVIRAIFKRNFLSYFSNPAGYVFITLFVFVSSWVAFWQPVFFTNNLANLAPLNDWMPYLLLFFIPAITMNTWAEERRLGTDELLFTLPAHDVDVVLGKYLAAVGIYTVALAFSLTQVAILKWLGSPDLGIMFATYLGYWLMGVMLIALGMVGSLLSANVTVAFILGAVFCAVPAFLGLLGSPLGGTLRRQFEDLSVPAQFHDFGTGVVPLAGLFYFVSLAAAFLYVNMVLLGRRHWAGGQASNGRWGHSLVRVVAVVMALASLNVLVARAGVRADTSAARLHTLSPETLAALKQIPKDRPVFIQAYYSPEVPREFVETKADMIGLLKEFAAKGGDKVRLNLVETELYSPQARDAEKRFGIEPRRVMTADEARQTSTEVFLGVAFNSGLEEVIIPFFDRGLPVEYELTRSLRVVSRSGRKNVGILNTDAKLMGNFDFRSMGQSPEWSIVTELKKQYNVSSVSPDATLPTDLDVLLVAQPSSLTQKQIDNLTAYVKQGGPVLLFLDPLPYENPQISPEVPRAPAGGPFGGGQPPEPKGDLRPLLELVGIDWPSSEIVWNPYNPHPALADLPPEVVFVSKHSGAEDAFNADQAVSSGLQEVVTLFPGLLRQRGGAGLDFTPLLRTNKSGGTLPFSEVMQQSFMGPSGINPNRPHFPTGLAYTLAARVQGKPAAEPEKAKEKDKAEEKTKEAEKKAAAIDVIAIADLDVISEQFFMLRRQRAENLELDNVTFVLNCVDVLAGDDAFVDLRKRRPEHRTLSLLEAKNKTFIEIRQNETKAAEDEAKQLLDKLQKRLDKEVEAVRSSKDMDERTKEIRVLQLQEIANRRLDVDKANIDDQKRKKILEIKGDTEQEIRRTQNEVRAVAIALPPLPPLILGLLVFATRLRRENQGANPNRLA
ncbi:ABC-2 type transport system permease protein [Singulisphaera sp. GP187]|uniref:Gldg family protein n=1 Tax=Singulisphaera sp. GP187 TaxID=1882752 RepID=UPI000926CF90|nr:Gldg family protein [Singulisphaera sp. GP187]SIN78699.1 ABC-2 type transport system permease protein [Singulisphaera sp. GP187]